MTATTFAAPPIVRWPTERPLFVLTFLAAAAIWIGLALSVVGIVWAVILLAFSWLGQAGMLAHVRGSAVKLGPQQFPELHEAVQRLGRQIGLDPMPDAYLLQAGGDLNAFAARLFRAPVIVLYSDLLRACGDNTAARDMIIAHELGHVHAGHLRWQWFLLPAYLVPFLGGALSRAREYTCDRYGVRGAGDRDSALLGLSILAAGAEHGPRVDRRVMVEQARDLDTGWMTVGQWLMSHPPLLKRMAALDPALVPAGGIPTRRGRVRAGAMVALLFLPVMGLAWAGVESIPGFLEDSLRQVAADADEPTRRQMVERDFAALTAFLAEERDAGRGLPKTMDELRARWRDERPLTPFPFDPFDGMDYGYKVEQGAALFWSAGPDGVSQTEDDIWSSVDAATVVDSMTVVDTVSGER